MRTKNVRVSKAKDAVVASLEVIAPEDPASLWEAMKNSKTVEKSLNISQQTDANFLKALAETYTNAVSWDIQRLCP